MYILFLFLLLIYHWKPPTNEPDAIIIIIMIIIIHDNIHLYISCMNDIHKNYHEIIVVTICWLKAAMKCLQHHIPTVTMPSNFQRGQKFAALFLRYGDRKKGR